ncbi:hypothetical protein [Paenibacillus chitinolyticus]|uniref:hypothetical protein n=1 Tax=Paenibacillus chitinolyticus TaxID=79263 RepID=UPI001C438E93|nr:hypothetical protein [Paenibacillus chitinolyticus]MBV6715766.1 hypothetical protein [Paenibacillus chitinolyticus]
MRKRYAKNLLALGVVASALLVGSQSAFASDGVGDSRETAIAISPNSAAVQTISDSTDVDYFKWTNDTGKTISSASFHLYSPSNNNYDLYFIHVLAPYNNFESTTTASDHGNGVEDSISFSPIYPGDTVYFKIYGHDSSQYGSAPYTVSFFTY